MYRVCDRKREPRQQHTKGQKEHCTNKINKNSKLQVAN